MHDCIVATMFSIVAWMNEATSGVLCFFPHIAALMRATAAEALPQLRSRADDPDRAGVVNSFLYTHDRSDVDPSTHPRHCERSEAIHLSVMLRCGLLRCAARSDGSFNLRTSFVG